MFYCNLPLSSYLYNSSVPKPPYHERWGREVTLYHNYILDMKMVPQPLGGRILLVFVCKACILFSWKTDSHEIKLAQDA